ncbi:MAG: phosphoribosylglycinamide formyltransferase [Bacteroidales bacterium]|nr:phosphoribosylglycinamide formyltransferase [Bacteroidales bacterium]
MYRLAIFASGSGTNAENIIRFFRPKKNIDVSLVICNKPGAKVIERAEKHGVETFVFSRDDLYHSDRVIELLRNHQITHIVLAGFLWLVPASLVKEYPGAIVNIHPALLPKYGGKGMYGSKVHETVIANREAESGITIHYVNEKYDDGNIIFQAKCALDENETPESLAAKIHQLEYEHYPRVIEKVVDG